MRSPLPMNPLGRQEDRQMAPPAYKRKRPGCPNDPHRPNTTDKNTRNTRHWQPNNRVNFPRNSHSQWQPNNRVNFPRNSHSQWQPNNRGSFPPNSHSHRQPNYRPRFPPNSHPHHNFKRNNRKSRRKKTKNTRNGQRVNAEESSSHMYHPPAPHNTTSFLRRARNNGGIAFDSPHDYTPISPVSPTINPIPSPNPNPPYSPGPDFLLNYFPTSPPNYPNPNPHDPPQEDFGCTTPIIHSSPNLSPPLSNNNDMTANENFSAGSLRRFLEEENSRMNGKLRSMEITFQDFQRRLGLLERIHTDHASRNINDKNEVEEASFSEKSIGN